MYKTEKTNARMSIFIYRHLLKLNQIGKRDFIENDSRLKI